MSNFDDWFEKRHGKKPNYFSDDYGDYVYLKHETGKAWNNRQAVIDGLKAQLIREGYVDNGGVLLRPPFGETPRFDLLDAKQAIIDELQKRIDDAIERSNHAHIGYQMLYKQFDDVMKILKGTTNEP